MAVDGLPSRVTKRHASIRDAMREVAIGTAYRKEATVVRSCSTASGSTLSLPGESSRPAGQTRRVSQHPAREHSALVSDSKHGSASSRGPARAGCGGVAVSICDANTARSCSRSRAAIVAGSRSQI